MNNEYLNIKNYPDIKVRKNEFTGSEISVERLIIERNRSGKLDKSYIPPIKGFKLILYFKGNISYSFYYKTKEELLHVYDDIEAQLPEQTEPNYLKDNQDYKQRVLKAIEELEPIIHTYALQPQMLGKIYKLYKILKGKEQDNI